LSDLFASLIENACHYTPAGGSVEVALSPTDDEDACVEIRDTGIGLTPDDAIRATERFYRGAAARRMFPGGSGLGLAIADRIARLHGGTLALEPRSEGGTIARVTLPLLG
jgi:two-component system phosphate regulon sensor histidine kinase PhoR